ncbi:hypothetical protein N9S57_02760 [Luminiphilus sp.]|nr:hypothetical protein [Luminiphilus sp.]MDA9625671.1 hypothetical protein [Luminiphilus sp.]
MRILLAIALVALVGCDYQEWSAERERKAEEQRLMRERNANLSYGPAGHRDWQYLNAGNVQYSAGDSAMVLRKVKSKEHVVMAYIDETGFRARAFWKTDCEEGTEIETSKTYSSGTPKILWCKRYGDSTWIMAGTIWPDRDEPKNWAVDFDGFKVDANFEYWDWTKAKQYATLQKAKPADSQEDE